MEIGRLRLFLLFISFVNSFPDFLCAVQIMHKKLMEVKFFACSGQCRDFISVQFSCNY